jgi:hypothetical protein
MLIRLIPAKPGRVAIWAPILILIAIATSVSANRWLFCIRTPSACSERPFGPVSVSPSPVTLGVLEPGQSSKATLNIKNETDAAIAVSRIETSCPCIRITPCPVQLEPQQAILTTVRFDPTEEPSFRGRLSVEYIGRAANDEVIFRGRVQVSVVETPGDSSMIRP